MRVTSSTTGLRCRDAEDDARHRTLEWLQWVELEIDNIRSVLQKCLATSDWRRGLELATSIGYYWVTRGTTESMRWFDELLAAAGGRSGHPGPGLSLPGMAEHAPDRARGGQAMAGPSDRGSPSGRASSRSCPSRCRRPRLRSTWREITRLLDGS